MFGGPGLRLRLWVSATATATGLGMLLFFATVAMMVSYSNILKRICVTASITHLVVHALCVMRYAFCLVWGLTLHGICVSVSLCKTPLWQSLLCQAAVFGSAHGYQLGLSGT